MRAFNCVCRQFSQKISVRSAKSSDILAMNHCNRVSLPENYSADFYSGFILNWPDLTFVAENAEGSLVAYCLGQIEENSYSCSGFLTSIAVMPEYRKNGVGLQLTNQLHTNLRERYQATSVSLHCRPSNLGAMKFYKSQLYEEKVYIPSYYIDGEAAWVLTKYL